MKRILAFFSVLFFISISFAQNKCIEFLGIPLDLPFEDFTKELKSKGFYPDFRYENTFVGTLYERQVGVTVYPLAETNTVEFVNVYFVFSDEIFMHTFYDEMKVQLSDEYKDELKKEITSTEFYYPRFVIALKKYKEDTEMDLNRCYGTITMFRDKVGENRTINQLTIFYARIIE